MTTMMIIIMMIIMMMMVVFSCLAPSIDAKVCRNLSGNFSSEYGHSVFLQNFGIYRRDNATTKLSRTIMKQKVRYELRTTIILFALPTARK